MNKIFYFLIGAALVSTYFFFSKEESKSFSRSQLDSFYEKKFIAEQSNENLNLKVNFKFRQITGNLINIDKLIKANSIVLVVSEMNCRACIDAEFKSLIESAKIKSLDNFFIWANYSDLHVLSNDYNIIKDSGLPKENIVIMESELNIPLNNLNTPYYFRLNKDLSMSNFFIPEKSIPLLSQTFLQNNLFEK